jgi:hypothetical protein
MSTVATQLSVSMPNYQAGGKVFNINTGGQSLASGTWSATGQFVQDSSQNATVKGFLAGASASSAGVAYQFSTGTATVQGVAAFSKNASGGL